MQKKRIFAFYLIFFFILALLPSYPATAAEVSFKDVAGHWAEKDIIKMAAKGVLGGLGGGKFGPGDTLTREQALAMLVRVLKLSATGSEDLSAIRDANKISAWARPALAIALREGIIAGADLLELRPQEPAKRFEVAVFIVRALGLTELARARSSIILAYKDVKDIPSWAIGYVALLKEKGLMSGDSQGYFRPLDTLTRAEMATLLARVDREAGRLADNELWGKIAYLIPPASFLLDDGVGNTRTITLAPGAAIFRQGRRAGYNQLAPGDELQVITDASGQAIFAEVLPPGSLREVRTVVRGNIKTIGEGKITLIRSGGGEVTFNLTESTQFELDGRQVSYQLFRPGQEVAVAARSGVALKVEATSSQQEYTGTIERINEQEVELKLNGGSLVTFKLVPESQIEIEGDEAEWQDLVPGQYATIQVRNGEVIELSARDLDWELEGTVVGISFAPRESITVKDKNGVEWNLWVSEQATIRRNGETTSLRDILAGDGVKLELKNRVITDLRATAEIRDIQGTLKAIVISANPSITIINKDGKEETFSVAAGARLRRLGKDIALGELKQGDYVEVRVEGNQVVRIDAESGVYLDYLTGVISNINQKARVIVLERVRGTVSKQEAFVDSDTLIIRNRRVQELDDLEIGDQVLIVGEIEAGIFMAEVVVAKGD
ncbi:MAG: hypothetical protein PWP65_1638 [Clostridia bacterium]|nr:hypothetical protein [Clostridia bacterium]